MRADGKPDPAETDGRPMEGARHETPEQADLEAALAKLLEEAERIRAEIKRRWGGGLR